CDRRRSKGTAAARAGPARRRTTTSDRAVASPEPAQEEPAGRAAGESGARRGEKRDRPVARGAARRGTRDPSGRAERPRARGRRGIAICACAVAGAAGDVRRGSITGARRGRRLLRHLGKPRQRRQTRARERSTSVARTARPLPRGGNRRRRRRRRRHRAGLGPARPRGPRRGAGRPAARVDAARRRNAGPGGDPLRVAIAEDSVLLREGLARLLGESGFEVVAQVEDPDDLLLKVRSFRPDVVIVDIRLPPTHNDEGLRAALEIREKHPSIGVLVLSQYVELGLALKLLADSAEGVGYLLKDRIGDVGEFLAAVTRVANGGSALDPIIVSTLLSRQRPDDPLARLTPREREVLELMASGSSNQGIADRLVITLRAVEKYVSSIFGKLGLPSTGNESRRVLAVLTFLRS